MAKSKRTSSDSQLLFIVVNPGRAGDSEQETFTLIKAQQNPFPRVSQALDSEEENTAKLNMDSYALQQLLAINAMQNAAVRTLYFVPVQPCPHQQQRQQYLGFPSQRPGFIGGTNPGVGDRKIHEDRAAILRRRMMKLKDPACVQAGDAKMAAMGVQAFTEDEENLIYQYGREEASRINPRIAEKYGRAKMRATHNPKVAAALGVPQGSKITTKPQQPQMPHNPQTVATIGLQKPHYKTYQQSHPNQSPNYLYQKNGITGAPSAPHTGAKPTQPSFQTQRPGTSALQVPSSTETSESPSTSTHYKGSKLTQPSFSSQTSGTLGSQVLSSGGLSLSPPPHVAGVDSRYYFGEQGTPEDKGASDPNIEDTRIIFLAEEAWEKSDPKAFCSQKEVERKFGFQEPTNAQKIHMFGVGREKAMAQDPDLAVMLQENVAFQIELMEQEEKLKKKKKSLGSSQT